MRLVCSQKDLASALNITSKAVDLNNTLPVLNNVLLKAEGKKLSFTTTNLEIAINYWVETNIKNEGEITIPSKLLTNYVNYLKDDQVEVSIEGGDALMVKTPDSKTKIKGIPASEFPPIPMVEKEGEVVVDSEDLARSISQVAFAASLNTTRPILSGVLFKAEKNELTLVATDSYRLSKESIKTKSLSGNVSVIIPAKTLMELDSILTSDSQEKEVKVTVSKNQVLFEVGRIRITSRLIDGQYPNYQQIIPSASKTKISFKASSLSLVLKRVNLFAKENNNKIILRITKEGVKVSTDTTQYGEGEVEIKTKVDGGDNEVAMNSQFLLDVLSNVGSDEVVIEVGEKTTPVVVKPTSHPSYIHIIMPLKI